MDKTMKKNNILSIILGIYVLLIGVGIPLVIRDGYFDILVVKYYYFVFCTVLLTVFVLLYFITIGRSEVVSCIKRKSVKDILKDMTFTDYAALAFLGVSAISTLTSDYLYESFWGNEGRLTGLFLITWYVACYFFVSKFLKFKKIYIDLILVAGIIVCYVGITDYFQLDILGLKREVALEQKAIFTSTIGNINTYTAYVGIISAISTVLFTLCKEKKRLVFYYLSMIISFFAIIMGVSDNAYLSLGALFVFLPLYLFNKKSGIRRYLVVVASFFSVIQCIDWINIYFKDKVLGINSVFNVVIQFKHLHFLVIGLWLIIVFWIIYCKNKSGVEDYGNLLRYIWAGIIAFTIMGIIYVIYDCNIAGNIDKYNKLSNYLVFNDDWGTHRGFIWRNAMECYYKFPVWKKFFGYGPETLGILLLQKTANNPYHQTFDNAHNEYLQFLITVGGAGLTSYVVIVFSNIMRTFRSAKKNPYLIAVAFGIICYSAQSVVNLDVPIIAPIFWLMLGIVKNENSKKVIE